MTLPAVSEIVDSSDAPISLRGWRVVRTLGVSDRATTALVIPDRPESARRPRVLRLFFSSTPDSVVDGEVAVHDALALAAADVNTQEGDVEQTGNSRPHWARAESLASTDDGRFGVLIESVTGPTAASWLNEHAELSVGHVVTLLAPIADAVRRAHDVGVFGLVPDLHGMRIDAAGTPIIVRSHRAVVRPVLPERFRRGDALHEHDRQALARLVTMVAGFVDRASRERVRSLAPLALDGAQSLWEALLAEAQPHALATVPPREKTLQHADADSSADAESPTVVERTTTASAPTLRMRLGETLHAWGLPESLRSSVDTTIAQVCSVGQRWRDAVMGRVQKAVPSVRPKFLVMGAAGVLAVVIAVASASAPRATAEESVSSVENERVSVTEPITPARSMAQDEPSATLPESRVHPEPDDWNVIVQQLLERWSSCRAASGGACSQSVVHPDSAAAELLTVEHDLHGTIDAWLLGDGELVVVQQMGAAVLVDLIEAERTTASLLLMRSEAGWRVRDVLD